MNELLIIGGISYNISSSKLPYVINTQFNYFKFPPRIKSLVVNDAINLDDIIVDTDFVSGRYTVSDDAGMPATRDSNKIVYRAGDFDISNAEDYYNLPTINPVGYPIYIRSYKRIHGGWVVPTILDMQTALAGNNFIKPSTFIVTPEMIDAGENIYFKIRVAVRTSLSTDWINFQKSPDPYEITKTQYREIRTPGLKNITPFQELYPNYDILWNDTIPNLPAGTEIPYNIYGQRLETVYNTILIELRLQRSSDDPTKPSNSNLGAMTGTFKTVVEDYTNLSTWSTNKNIGSSYEERVKELFKEIAVLDTEYISNLAAYNNALALITDRSTSTQRNELILLKNKVDSSKIKLDDNILRVNEVQQQLKQARLNHIKTNKNPHLNMGPFGNMLTESEIYDVQRLNPITSNIDDLIYEIDYMIDINTAKAYDEYYITTACGNPFNIIYKQNTTWDIVPQSKLATIL